MNPDALSDRDWAQKFQDWVYVTRVKNEALSEMIGNKIRIVCKELFNL